MILISCGIEQFSTKFNRNKYERIKGHFHGDARPVREISFNDATKVYICPTVDCRASSEYEHNIIKHLKSCYQVNSNKKVAGYNKTCSIYHKYFLKKSNRDRHMKTVHQNDSQIADLEEKGQHLNDDEYLDEELPSMVYNAANQSQVSSMEIESEVSISFQHSESSIISPFPILEPSNLPLPHVPACLTTCLLPLLLPHLPTYLLNRLLSLSLPHLPACVAICLLFLLVPHSSAYLPTCLLPRPLPHLPACLPISNLFQPHLISQFSNKELAFRTLLE